MEHIMQLRPSPFNMIKNKMKSIELRLYDEKRQKIKIGDTIRFYNTENFEQLTAVVKELFIFESFEELYKSLPLNKCGYTASNIGHAKPEDMLQYYPLDKQKQYKVVGIQVELR